MTSIKSQFGAIFLITGCCVGAGMIGLPVLSALSGFIPSTVAMFICYIFTTLTGLLLLEATLWFEGKVNLPTIVEFSLGKIGKMITTLLFLFLFYSIFVAYLDVGASFLSDLFQSIFHIQPPRFLSVGLCALSIAMLVYPGFSAIKKINFIMLVGMALAYVGLVTIGLPEVAKENLLHTHWSAMLGVMPILMICFGYQNLVPSMTYYLQKNVKAVRAAIIIGNFLPFLIYLLWNYVIIGMISPFYLSQDHHAVMVTELLGKAAVTSIYVIFLVKMFSMLAMLTSFIPSAMSFVDFMKDGFNKFFPENKKLLLHACVFVPPFIFATLFLNVFLSALSFAGGFIDVLLFGVLPALVVVRGRKIRDTASDYQVAGGMVTPLIVFLMSVFILAIKIFL